MIRPLTAIMIRFLMMLSPKKDFRVCFLLIAFNRFVGTVKSCAKIEKINGSEWVKGEKERSYWKK
jgi:hypothetical protein